MSNRDLQWTLHPVESLSRFAASWDQLATMSMTTSVAVQTLLEHFGDGRQQLAVCAEHLPGDARAQGPVSAMAIISPRGRGVWETCQPSQAPVGLWVQQPMPLDDVLPGLMRELGCLSFGVLQQDPDISPRSSGSSDYIDTARILVKGSFEDYWSQRGKLRTNLQSQRRKLEKAGLHPRLEIVRDPAKIGAAVDDFARMESAGWKAKEGTAVALETAQGRFYRTLMERMALRGEALACRYYFGDKLVACDLSLLRDGTLIGLKTTYDEHEKSMSPGMLMRQDMLRELWDRLVRVEFYGRVTEWHLRWTNDVRTMYHVTAFRWNWLRAVRSAMRRQVAPRI